MSLSLVVDENVDFSIVSALQTDGYEVYAIVHECPGITDQDVLALAIDRKSVLLTEDSDFGEWIFAHGQQGTSVLTCAMLKMNCRTLYEP